MTRAKKRIKKKDSTIIVSEQNLPTPVYPESESIFREVDDTFKKMKRLQKFHNKPLDQLTHHIISYTTPYSNDQEIWIKFLKEDYVKEEFLYNNLNLELAQLIDALVSLSDQLVNEKMFHYLSAYAYSFDKKGKLYEAKFLAILASRFLDLDGLLTPYHKMKHYVYIHKLFKGDFTTRIRYTCKIIEVLEQKHPDLEVYQLQTNAQKVHLAGVLGFFSASKRGIVPIHYTLQENQIVYLVEILSKHLPDLLNNILFSVDQSSSTPEPHPESSKLSPVIYNSPTQLSFITKDDPYDVLEGIVYLIDAFIPLSTKYESTFISLSISLMANCDALMKFIQFFSQNLISIFNKLNDQFHDKNMNLNKSLELFLSGINAKKLYTKPNLFARLRYHIEQVQLLTESDLAPITNLGYGLAQIENRLSMRYFETIANYEQELLSIRESIKAHLPNVSTMEKASLIKIIAQLEAVKEKGVILLPLYTQLNHWLTSLPKEIKIPEVVSEYTEVENTPKKTARPTNKSKRKAGKNKKKLPSAGIKDSAKTFESNNSTLPSEALSVRLEPSVLAFKPYPDLQIKQQQIFNLLILSNTKHSKTAYKYLEEADSLNREFFRELEKDNKHLAFAYVVITQIDIIHGLYRINKSSKNVEAEHTHDLFINQQKLVNTLNDTYHKLAKHVSLLFPSDSTEMLIINDLKEQTELANSVLVQLQAEIKKKQSFYQSTFKSEGLIASKPLVNKSCPLPKNNNDEVSLSTSSKSKKTKTKPQDTTVEPKTWAAMPFLNSEGILSMTNPQEFPKLGTTNLPAKLSEVKNSPHRLFKPTKSRNRRLNKQQFMQKAQGIFPSDWIVNYYDYQMLDYWYPVVTDIIKAKQYLTFKEKNGMIDLEIIRSAHPHNGSVFTYVSNLPIIINPYFTVAHHIISSTQQGFQFECENEKTKQLLRQLVDQVLYECGETGALAIPTCNILVM